MSKHHAQAIHGKRSVPITRDVLVVEGSEQENRHKGKAVTRTDSVDESNARPTKRRRLDKPHDTEPTVVYYNPPSAGQETALYIKLRGMDHHGSLARYLKWSRKLLIELGSCAADLLWRQVFLEDLPEASTLHDRDLYRKIVEEWQFDMPNVNSMSKHCNVTPQFTSLLDILRSCSTDTIAFRGIIYVKRPVTAVMLAELLRVLDDNVLQLRPAVITSSSMLGSSQDKPSILNAFTDGTYNLLITNKLAECDKILGVTTIIYFDLTEDLTASLINAHARAATVYMAEKDNSRHQEIIQPLQRPTAATSHGRHSIPPSEVESSGDEMNEFLEDPTTGARIYRRDAAATLCRYLDYLRDAVLPGGVDIQHVYTLERPDNGEAVLRLSLPRNMDLPEPIQVLAKQASAGANVETCFAICRDLFHQGYLDYRFFDSPSSSPQDEVDSDNLKTANQSANTRCYPRRRPSYCSRAMQHGLDRLYPLVVTVGAFRDGAHAPMLILSRLPWPRMDSFSVYSNGQEATVRLTAGSPLLFGKSEQQLLVAYTMRVARALANKPLECKEESLLYLYAPLNSSWNTTILDDLAPWQLLDVETHIAWEQVKEAADQWASPLVSGRQAIEESRIADAIIQDRAVEFTNRHFVTKLRRDLSPLSKPDPDSREGKYESYLDFCKEHRKDFQGLQDEQQPLIEVILVPPMVNNLSPASKINSGTTKPSTKVFIPEFCHRFTIPASTFRTALLLPSITHMIECMLLVKEMSVAVFDRKIHERHLLEAVTPAATQVAHNYERLELLGDTLLKNVMSMYYFVTMPAKREGALNGARAQAVCNKALHANALAAGITPWIQSKPFVPKIWTPCIVKDEKDSAGDGTVVDPPADEKAAKGQRRTKQQKRQAEVDVQWLGDKTVADVVEALIGAAFHNGGIDTVLQVMRTLQFKMPEIRRYDDFWRIYQPHMASYKASLPAKTLEAVKAITGYHFPVPAILAEALTHGSLTAGKHMASYDRLEFLGDSILDFHVVWYIFQSHPHMSPGGLSLLKGAMVSNQTLATVAVLTGLHEHVRCAPDVQASIQLYAHKILALRDQEYRLADAEGRLPAQFWLDVEAPKALGDVVEAVVAAICLSDRLAMEGVEAFFRAVLQPFYARHVRVHTLAPHPSKSLFELLQAEGCQQHAMRKRPAEGGTQCEVVLHGVVLASAVDVTTHASMRKTANAALDALAGDPGFVARHCDCKAQRSNKKAQKGQAKQAGYED